MKKALKLSLKSDKQRKEFKVLGSIIYRRQWGDN